MVYSQIWLNLLVDIRQFGYTKLKTTHPKKIKNNNFKIFLK
jgi:hypothetical protein